MLGESLLASEAPAEYAPSSSHPPHGKGLLARFFYRHGVCVARNPVVAMVLSALVAGCLALGFTMLTISSNPQAIWVPPGSRTSKQQSFFNAAFDPFYRVEQVIFTPTEVHGDGSSVLENNILSPKTVKALQDFQERMANTADSAGTRLDDLCFKPIAGKGCLVESVTNFAADNRTVVEALTLDGLQSLLLCRKPGPMLNGTTLSTSACMSGIGVPVMPSVVLGGSICSNQAPGASKNSVCHGTCEGRAAQALMTTFLLNAGPNYDDRAARWEEEVFLPLARDFRHPGLNTSYMAQRSVQDQIGVVANQNTFVVLISYVAMFAYIVVAMGKFPHPVRSRALLGLGGIFVVVVSVCGAMGAWGFGGGSITMIVTEVVPFLILAIGVDNMFIITKTADRIRARRIATAISENSSAKPAGAVSGDLVRSTSRPLYESDTPITVTGPEPPTPMPSSANGFVPVERLMGEVLAEVGPTITAAATAEALAFAMGASTSIPALQQFCAVAAIAVSIDFVMQMTFFVGAVSVDFHRMDAELPDCLPCIGCICTRPSAPDDIFASADSAEVVSGWCGTGSTEATVAGEMARRSPGRFWYWVHRGEYARSLLGRYVAPITLSLPVRLAALAIWLGFLGLSAYAATVMHLGLAQQLAVPDDSYLYSYFNQQAALGEAGPPAYVVLQNVNYSDSDDTARTALSRLSTSLGALTDHIVPPVYNWYSEFRSWSSAANIASMKAGDSLQPPYNCPLPLDPATVPQGRRVEQFLYDIPIDSPCCLKKAHCYSQYGPDVKLLWVVNSSLADAARTAANAPGPTALVHRSIGEAPVVAASHADGLHLVRSRPFSGTASDSLAPASDGAPWSSSWWDSAPSARLTPDGQPDVPEGATAVVAGSRREAVERLLTPGAAGAQADGASHDSWAPGSAPAHVAAAAAAAEAWRVAAAQPGPSSARSAPFLQAAHLHGLTMTGSYPSAAAAALAVARDLVPYTVMTSRMRTVHTALRDQADFVGAMQATQAAVHRLAADLPTLDPADIVPPGVAIHGTARGINGSRNDNQHVGWLDPAPGPVGGTDAAFPYSLFYVYYEQYDYIRGVAVSTVLVSLGATFLAVLAVTTPAVATVVAAMVVTVAVDVIGIVWLLNPAEEGQANALLSGVGDEQFGVDVNAVSVVNIVTAVGLAVEFSVHIASFFAAASGTRLVRARKALAEMGSNVVTGITLTKLVGVLVLAWAPSQMFRLYYFRMYLAIIIAGAFQGLIVLPALLSLCGPASVHEIDYVRDAKTGARRERLLKEYTGPLKRSLLIAQADERTPSQDSNDSYGPSASKHAPTVSASATESYHTTGNGSLQRYASPSRA
ncbi:hypothetical protein FNF27_07942 [Cafeteria roenbergensis]|uniref:SSD domain-containing protein n=2 Tax=Cafeteria roenbergensis TaxID=33653 RepID=A0A5A8DDR8_CAFRO|nr:hypothetical protein FNF27_07942 [Cafeteria roenbergensis]